MSKHAQTTCQCRVYKFPHRFNSGRCIGIKVVCDHWQKFYGYDSTCHDCACFVDGQCQVLEGQEKPHQCPIWQEYVLDTGARIKPNWRKYL